VRKHGEKWSDIFLRFGELQADATQKLIKTGSALVLYYLLLVSISDPYTVSVSFQSVEASIPTAFLTLIASVTFYFFLLQFQSLLMILGLRTKESGKIPLRGFSSNAYGFLFGQDEMALVTPVHANQFFERTSSHLDTACVLHVHRGAFLYIANHRVLCFPYHDAI
jgi:hypothetical protein